MPSSTLAEQAREARLRQRAARQGLILPRSRLRGRTHGRDYGGYMIIDANLNMVLGGASFGLDLDDVERWLSD